ncbi:uncharacterized protein RJT20DRAFT_126807 [Scheffersomyces xylosifermentans]|uniref:uncharacterized protein n=1 Tax=Scheffersomyces xylosifermentans TaxID=1304137 RepID=UPI00315D4322
MDTTPENEMVNKPEFEVSTLTKIPTMTVDELTELENELADEFSSLSKSYISSRLSRIDKLLEKIGNSIKVATANDKNWLKIFNFEIETINNIKTNTEDLILLNSGYIHNKGDILKSIEEYEEELKEIFKNLQSPLDFDETLGDVEFEQGTKEDSSNTKLPFPYLFDKFFKPHKRSLQTIINEKDYQSRLIYNNSKGNAAIIWKSYYYNLMRHKQELVQETYNELNNLYKEYHHLNEQEVNKRSAQNYYRSVVTPNDLKRSYDDGPNNRYNHTILNTTNTHDYKLIFANNRDSNYANTDNQYLQKNKIELTSIKTNILNKSKRFERQQERGLTLQRDTIEEKETVSKNSREDLPPLKRIKLNTCLGLVDDDIEADLKLLRNEIKNKNEPQAIKPEVFTEEADIEIENSRISDDEKSGNEDSNEDISDDEDDYDDGDDSDEMSDIEELTKEEQELKIKYKKLLGLGSDPASMFTIPDLPPLDQFPASRRTSWL